MQDKIGSMNSLRDVPPQSIPDCFEQHARNHPNRVAFKTKKIVLTWDALNQNANRVACAILGTRKSLEKPIALLLDQTSMMPVTMGVLKAGGFYVPLSRSHPLARNNYILRETEADLIVTDGRSLSLARELAQGDFHLLNIDELDSSLSTENLGLPVSPDSLAFLAYTSGSTGEPKGVINTHRKVLHRLAHDQLFELGSDDRFTNVGSAERTAFSSLLSGAGAFPWYVREEGLEHLADWLTQEEITVCRFGPRVFRQFMSTLTCREKFPKLRAINLTGAPACRTDIELFRRQFPSDCVLVNTLGTHEVGPFRMYLISKETHVGSEIVPVGYEVPEKEVLLLDNNRQRLGFDEVGEIAVRSRYLSPGYWRRPDLTNERFLPDPEGGDQRIYLTGDLGRMSLDGCLEHIGRKDFQVKIRGFRVDISEVESAILKHPGVREAIVTARQDRLGDAQLVAYFVPRGDLAPTVTSLRNFLKEKLPDYMIPAAFVRLNEIPLTTTGTAKVDRRALPDPGNARPDLDTPFATPKTSVEKELSKIWAQVLAINQVGIHDSFFDLGGHSLAATRVVSQVIKQFQLELPLQSLFESTTVATMAAVITEHQGKKVGEKELDRILTELESLTDEEARRLLADKSATVQRSD
jgi:amino acid adenylation domain-containing protein